MRLVYEQAMRLKREAAREATRDVASADTGGGGRMARPPRGGGPINSDDFTGFSLILIVVGLCILGWASWQVWHAEISRVALLVAHYEMQAIGVVTDRFSPPTSRFNTRIRTGFSSVSSCGSIATSARSSFIPPWRWFWRWRAFAFLRAGNARFTRTFDLEKLMAEQAIHSRSTAAFVGRRLKLSKLRAGEPRPADAALHVDEWVARYATSEKSGFDEAAARREFMRQLGGRWTGPGAASPAVRSMLAVFALQGVQRRDEAARAAWIAVGRVATPQSRRRGRAGRAARLRSEDASPRRSRARDGGSLRLGVRGHGEASFYDARPHVGAEPSAAAGAAFWRRRSSPS